MRAGLHAQDAIGQRVTSVVIVEEPDVDAGFAQRGLDPFQVQG